MLGVLVEINGLTQLAKLERSVIEETQKKLLSYLNLRKEDSLWGGNYFYFHLSSPQENVALAWRSIQRLLQYLLSRRDEYQGFLIVVDELSGFSLANEFLRMRKISLPLREMDALHLTFRASESFPRMDELTKKGNFMLFRGVEGPQITGAALGDDFFRREKLIDKIKQRLIPQFDEEPYRGPHHFHGPRGIGKLWNLQEALKDTRINGLSPEIPAFIGGTRETFPGEALLISIPSNLLGKLEQHFTPLEKRAWEDRKFLLRASLNDNGGSDCLIFLRLYFTAYRRACEETLTPPLIIIQKPDEFSQETAQILLSLLQEKQKAQLVPLVITEKSELPPPWDRLDCRRMDIRPLSLEEVKDRLEKTCLKEPSLEGVLKRCNGELPQLAHYILLKKLKAMNFHSLAGGTLSSTLAANLEIFHYRIIYILSLYSGVMDKRQWIECLNRGSIPLDENPKKVLDELFAMGLAENPRAVRLQEEGLERGCDLSELEKTSIRQGLLEFWISLCQEEKYRGIFLLLLAFRYDPPPRKLFQLLFEGIFRNLEAGRGNAVEEYLEEFESYCKGGKNSSAEAVLKTLWLHLALIRGDREMARVRFLAFNEIPENPLTLAEGLYNLEAGRYYHACGEYQKALEDGKNALLYFQNYENSPLIEADANCQIGLVMVGQRRFEQGIAYFTMAQEILGRNSSSHKLIKAILYKGACYFLLGNYAKAQRIAQKAQEKSAALGRREWELFAVLLQGRISFELGDYMEAEQFFVQGLNYCEIYFAAEGKQIFYAWMIRCQIYQKRTTQALPLLKTLRPTCEVLYFTAEAIFFRGQRHRSLQALDLALKNGEGQIDDFSPGENLSWRTGFANLEDRAMRKNDGTGVLVHCVRAFRGYLLGLEEGRREEGCRELFRIIRDEKICDEDPYTHFYYYLYNQIVPINGNTETVDRLTLLSRGLKHLQLRGGHIDETKIRQAYLHNNYWNEKLMKEGQSQRIL